MKQLTFGAVLLFVGVILMHVISGLPSVPDSQLIWSKSTAIPEPRSDYGAGVLDGKLVVVGGTYWTGTKGNWEKKHFSSSTHAFDPTTQQWEKLPDLPITLGCPGAAVIGEKLYILGGYTGTEVNRAIYTLAKKQGRYHWERFGSLPLDRVYPRAVSIGKSLYLLGGTTRFERRDPTGTCCTSKTATTTFMELDSEHPERGWRDLEALPGPLRFYFSADTDGKSVWMFGGFYQEEPKDPIKTYSDVYRYDLKQAKWVAMKPFPQVSQDGNSPSPVVTDQGIILISDSKKVWRLDSKTSEYAELAPLPEAAAVDRFVWIKNRIVGGGGENFIEAARRRSEWVFIGRFGSK